MDLIDDPVLNTFAAGTMLLSLATGLYLIYTQFQGPILRYVPRRPVPWGAFATVVAVLYLFSSIAAAMLQSTPEKSEKPEEKTVAASPVDPGAKVDSTELAEQLLGGMAPIVLVVAGFAFIVAIMSHASPRDLGWPSSWYELAIDARTGFVAALAALLPVHLIQGVLSAAMGIKDSGHELVKLVREGESSVMVMVLAGISAVVVAPICEEVAFRLLLQGWLEKWEDRKLGWRAGPTPVVSSEGGSVASDVLRLQLVNGELLSTDADAVGEVAATVAAEPANIPPPPEYPPERGLAGLPHGWLPIIISSVMFGVAHLGYGPEPVPLFFLALFLGYLYQRTHRIVPSIVCHACFNAFTVFVLWRIVFHGAR